MVGQFYYHDMAELTHLELNSDGRAVSYARYYRFNQYLLTFPSMSVETNQIYVSRGKHRIEESKIKVIVRGELGRIVFQGTIKDEDSMDLFWRCPFTNERKSAVFTRYSKKNHIIHFELSLYNTN